MGFCLKLWVVSRSLISNCLVVKEEEKSEKVQELLIHFHYLIKLFFGLHCSNWTLWCSDCFQVHWLLGTYDNQTYFLMIITLETRLNGTQATQTQLHCPPGINLQQPLDHKNHLSGNCTYCHQELPHFHLSPLAILKSSLWRTTSQCPQVSLEKDPVVRVERP